MNFGNDTVLFVSTNLMDLGLSSVNTIDELRSVFAYTTRIGSEMHGPDWLPRSHCIYEDTAEIVRRMNAKNHYDFKSEYEIRREKW